MVRDTKYIIKRIIIGVGIALVLSLLRGNFLLQTKAMGVASGDIGSHSSSITSQITNFEFDVSPAPFSEYANTSGYLYIPIGITKTSGASTDPFPTIRGVVVSTGSTTGYNYVCDLGSSIINNSTFIGYTYTAKCPVNMSSTGLRHINVAFLSVTNNNSYYTIRVGSGVSYEIPENANVQVNVDTSGTTSAINNQTQSITNNQNQNTQSIINNQNSNTENIIESQQACTLYDKSSIKIDNTYINASGVTSSNTAWGLTDYIDIYNSKITFNQSYQYGNMCFYNDDLSLNSCLRYSDYSNGSNVVIPSNAKFVRFVIMKSDNRPIMSICKNGNQAIVDSQKDINNTLNNDDISGASSEGSDFFSNFSHNSHGISGIITAPIRLLNSLTTSSCSPLEFNLPFVHNHVVLPCMRSIYETHFGVFFSLYQLITTGLICYSVMINLYSKIHNLQNPFNDRIEVLNL